MTNEQILFEGLKQILLSKGYDLEPIRDEIEIIKDGISIIILRSDGAYKQHQGIKSELVYEVLDIYHIVKESYDRYDEAEKLNYEGLGHFRKLAGFNGYVLAARLNKDLSLEFVTWQQTYGNTGVTQGHYIYDYKAAKEDFAVRSGLMDGYKMLSETELKLIHQGLVFLGKDDENLTAKQMKDIGELIEKVEMIVPEIKTHSLYEQHDLVAEDGLDV